MSDLSITVENLGKRYCLPQSAGHTRHRPDLREAIANKFATLLPRGSSSAAPSEKAPPSHEEDFWALKSISFEIRRGERVGFIGRNGAGKSTLLKILSRITPPTTGRAVLHGTVASLLEVGTGFHPDLTGRENIFLNGAILGMRKQDIQRRFDEIVSFAEVERFLDTPVKRYSSGMYVRLAFAIAAHLEPEILIVDEVLAVGDAQFQKKCLNLLQSNSVDGRTVLFVSHSMASVRSLCDRAICINRGELYRDGRTDCAIESYLALSREVTNSVLSHRTDRSGNSAVRFLTFELCDLSSGQPIACVPSGQSCTFKIRYQTSQNIHHATSLNLGIGIDDPYGNRVAHLSNETTGQRLQLQSGDTGCIEVTLKEIPLGPGNYSITLFATVGGDVADWVKDAGIICIAEGDFFHTGKLPPVGQGGVYLHHSFTNVVTRG